MELTIGKVYIIKRPNGLVRAKFINEITRTGYTSPHAARKSPDRKHYLFENISTGRTIEVKSKLRIKGMVAEPKPWMICGNGHQNLTSTIEEEGGKCPQCGAKCEYCASPKI